MDRGPTATHSRQGRSREGLPLWSQLLAVIRAMSLVETAKMNGLDRQAWLAEILDRIHNHMTNPLNEPLPWNWTPMN